MLISFPKRLLGLVVLLPMSVIASGDAAVDRTRREVKMLDDLYKTAVVLITKHYVNDPSSVSGATAAQLLFAAMREKGWHDIRLVDASGKPINPHNAAQDDFEKAAVASMKAGGSWHEQVVEQGGKRYLRAATPIPVVLEKCAMCHPNFKDVPAGEAIGMLSYTVPVGD